MALYDGVNQEEAFAADPPSWAQDPWNWNCADQCPFCNAWMDVVRPGKTQPVCDCQDSDK